MSNTAIHGFTLEASGAGGHPVLFCKAWGTLTHEDYQALIPKVEQALATMEPLTARLFFDTMDLEGWEFRAALDDLGFGLRQGKRFDKVAVLTTNRLMALSCRVGGMLTAGEMKAFEQRDAAMAWLAE